MAAKKPTAPKGETFADLRKRSRSPGKAGGGAVTVQTPPPRPMISPNIPNAAALRASTMPMPLKKSTLPMPLKSLDPYANGAKRGGRQLKKDKR